MAEAARSGRYSSLLQRQRIATLRERGLAVREVASQVRRGRREHERRPLLSRGKGRAAGRGRRKAAGTGQAAFNGVDTAAVRAWAAANGLTVSPRGRIKDEVIEAYRAAGN